MNFIRAAPTQLLCCAIASSLELAGNHLKCCYHHPVSPEQVCTVLLFKTAAMHKILLLVVPLAEIPHPANVIHQLVDKKPLPISMHNALLVHELRLFPFLFIPLQ